MTELSRVRWNVGSSKAVLCLFRLCCSALSNWTRLTFARRDRTIAGLFLRLKGAMVYNYVQRYACRGQLNNKRKLLENGFELAL